MDRHLVSAALTGGLLVFLCQALLADYRRKMKCGDSHPLNSEELDENLVQHRGSCLCRRVIFRVKGPKVLQKMKSAAKATFPSLNIPWYCFELLSEESAMSLYTKQNLGDLTRRPDSDGISTTDIEIEVLAFCSFCGVHILYSPSLEPEKVQVNLDCITRETTENINRNQIAMTNSNIHNKRGKGAYCSPHLALNSFRSMLFENLTNAFEYAGLPNIIVDRSTKTYSKKSPYNSHSNSKWKSYDNDWSSGVLSEEKDKDRNNGYVGGNRKNLLKELSWTQLLSESHPNTPRNVTPNSGFKNHINSNNLWSDNEGKSEAEGYYPDCGGGVTDACTPSTDSSLGTDPSDVETNCSDLEDSNSVLSSLLISEGYQSPSRESIQSQQIENQNQNQTKIPYSQSYRKDFSTYTESLSNKEVETFKIETPSRLHQLRRHLSQHLRKSYSKQS